MACLPARIRPAGRRRLATPVLLALLLGLALLAGCSQHYSRGQFLESQQRWEEAAIEYHLAAISDPDDQEYRDALARADKVVARENFDRYKRYLAQKAFRKAYARLIDASRQDPTYEPVQAEKAKWLRVLVSGQVKFDFNAQQANIALADQIKLVARLNTPNPGETLDAEIDIDSGIFFAEDLLYDRPDELLTYYSLNAIGVSLTRGRSRIQQFRTTEFKRLVSFRTPILDDLSGRLAVSNGGELMAVAQQRPSIVPEALEPQSLVPRANPHYSLALTDHRIEVSSPEGRSDFTPRFLYMNKKDRRLFVDFGRYELRLDPMTRRWGIRRLPLTGGGDYFGRLSQNVALQPYLFYREGVFAYVPGRSG